MAGALKISVIVPVYNSEDTIASCLTALTRIKDSLHEIIVVDDHSTDRTLEKIKGFGCSLIQMPERRGAAAARNMGAGEARGDILLFVDADTVIHKDALEKISKKFSSDPNLGALMGSYSDETACSNFVSVYKNLLHHFTHQTSYEQASTFWTGCGAIRREIFERIGGFDEDYKSASVEDIELGYRLSTRGIPILLARDIQVSHLKCYTLISLIKSDLFCRAIPWTKIMLRKRIFKNDLNTKSSNVAGLAVSYLSLIAAAIGIFHHSTLMLLPVLALVFILLNREFLLFVKKKRGLFFAFGACWMIYLGYIYSGLGFGLGLLSFLREQQKERKILHNNKNK